MYDEWGSATAWKYWLLHKQGLFKMTEKASMEYIQNSGVFSANSLVEDTFKMAEASVKFTRAVLQQVSQWWDEDNLDEGNLGATKEILEFAITAGLVRKWQHGWALTKLGEQVLS